MGNRLPQPITNRAAPRCDSEINSPKYLSKTRTYEAKYGERSCGVCLSPGLRAPATNLCVGELLLLFILAAGGFSNLFTTYSHKLCCCPRQRA